jgi:hypothetical protein
MNAGSSYLVLPALSVDCLRPAASKSAAVSWSVKIVTMYLCGSKRVLGTDTLAHIAFPVAYIIVAYLFAVKN